MSSTDGEMPFFPENPEANRRRYRTVPLLGVQSKDGINVEFTITLDLENVGAGISSVCCEVTDDNSSVHVPTRVLTDIGSGNSYLGLTVLGDKIADLELETLRSGSVHPLYTDVIFPFYGGEEGYVSSMGDAK
jgi:hypothetical protein